VIFGCTFCNLSPSPEISFGDAHSKVGALVSAFSWETQAHFQYYQLMLKKLGTSFSPSLMPMNWRASITLSPLAMTILQALPVLLDAPGLSTLSK